MRRDVRFWPPACPVRPEVGWMLERAFGPVGAAARQTADPAAALAGDPAAALAGDPAAALATCRRFEVAARVAARWGSRLAADLGGAAAEGFLRERAAAAASGLRAQGLSETVAAVAARLGVPVVFLKLAALDRLGVLAPGSRAGCDLDVLVPAARAEDVRRALLAAGFRASAMPDQEHQLAALEGPGGIVEVHRMLLGVRLDGRRSAGVSDLARAGLLVPVAGLSGDAAVPVPAVAAAHALVHGIAQHGWAPGSYSLLKMMGDLQDLGLGGPAGEALAEQVAAWVTVDVPRAEVASVRRLAAALAAGVGGGGGGGLDGWEGSQEPEARLLRHAVAGRLDAGYERSLRLALFRRQPSDRPAPVRLAAALLAAIWLSRAQVDAIYGRPRHRLGYLGRQLGRPFDLLARLGRYALHAWRVRRRPPGVAGGPRSYTPAP